MRAPDRRPARPHGPQDRPRTLRELGRDPDYLALKDAMGEPLTAAERELLEAARSGSGPKKIGGGGS